MRLLELKASGEYGLTKDYFTSIPQYAILSHTWGDDDQEVTFKDMENESGRSKIGYQKIRFCGEQALRAGLQYFWIDTCCIDKSNNAELTEALNSMYRWYQNAAKCFVYLADVSIKDYNPVQQTSRFGEEIFRKSRWFTRGWTLQELIAPQSVEFFSHEGELLGDKRSLGQQIHDITRIPISALRGKTMADFSAADKFSWATDRETQKEEDKIYSLLGIFDAFMPLIYGEGRENAFKRLLEEIDKNSKHHKLSSGAKFTVPFARDPKFVGREDIIQQITDQFTVQELVALYGIGGIGKSQVAIEYCYIWKGHYPQCHVFWIHVSTFGRFEQAYSDIAKIMSIPGIDDPQNDILILLQDWLSKPENGSWLLVLDNADDLELFFYLDLSAKEAKRPRISHYLARNANSFMIITTGDKRIGQRLTDRGEIVTITPLAPLDAEHLFRGRMAQCENVDTEDIQDLTFIEENSTGVKVYTEELKQIESDLQDYLEEDLPDPRRYPDGKNSVIRTWKLSFDQIARQKPRAAELLSLMVQLDRQTIPKALLKNENKRSIEFNKAIGTLQAYSLTKTEKGGSTFEIHRLVQLSTQRWLRSQNSEVEWQLKALELMVRKLPSGNYGTWQECEELFLHAKAVIKYGYISEAMLLKLTTLLQSMARYEESQGRHEAASLHYDTASQIRKSNLGEEHSDTLVAMNNLALSLERQGKYTKSEAMNREVLELTEKVYGKNHLGNLAVVLAMQGKYNKSEVMTRQVLELREEALGEEHPDTLATMNNLAYVLQNLYKYTESEAKTLGKEHPDTLITMNNLALVLGAQGKYSESEALNRRTLELSVHDDKRPARLTTMSNLAFVLGNQGKSLESEVMTRQVLKLREEVLGKEHHDTYQSIYNLAFLLQAKKEYDEASILYQKACDGFKATLGVEHPTTIECEANYSVMLNEMNGNKSASSY
ncbi:kinesin light chain 1 [Xylogone sp. PMI_703]|nr:kinesin light chain 1 [Xylogone sp. PMI_703]